MPSIPAGAVMHMNLMNFDCDGTLVDSQHMIVAAMDRAFAGQRCRGANT